MKGSLQILQHLTGNNASSSDSNVALTWWPRSSTVRQLMWGPPARDEMFFWRLHGVASGLLCHRGVGGFVFCTLSWDLAKKKSSNLAFPQLDKLTMVSFFFCISAAQISSVGLYVSFGVKSCKSRLGELQVSYLIDYSIRSQIVVAVNFLNYV
jgi:hypothetical protein